MATRKTAAPTKDTLGVRRPAFTKTDELNLTTKGTKKPVAKLPRKKDALGVLADKTIAAKKGAMSQEELAKRPRKMADVRASRAEKKPRKTTAEVSASLAKKARAISVSPLGATKIKTETRSAAAKRADPAPEVKLPFAVHEAKNTGQLNSHLASYPLRSTWTADFKFGVNIVNVLNVRGRKVAEIRMVPKK